MGVGKVSTLYDVMVGQIFIKTLEVYGRSLPRPSLFTANRFYFHQLFWLLMLAITIINEWVTEPSMPARCCLIIALLVAFLFLLLRLQPFNEHMYWKLPIRAALVVCTILSELSMLSTYVKERCQEKHRDNCGAESNLALVRMAHAVTHILTQLFTCCITVLLPHALTLVHPFANTLMYTCSHAYVLAHAHINVHACKACTCTGHGVGVHDQLPIAARALATLVLLVWLHAPTEL